MPGIFTMGLNSEPHDVAMGGGEAAIMAAPDVAKQQLSVTDEYLSMLEQLTRQLKYYFSFENLSQDTYLVSKMNSDHYVPISVLASFKKVKALTLSMNDLVKCLRAMDSVRVNDVGDAVKPIARRLTVILRDVVEGTSEAEVEAFFSGVPDCPVPHHVRADIGDTWFVTFNSEDDALRALDAVRQLEFKGRLVVGRIKSENLFRNTPPSKSPSQSVSSTPPMVVSPPPSQHGMDNIYDSNMLPMGPVAFNPNAPAFNPAHGTASYYPPPMYWQSNEFYPAGYAYQSRGSNNGSYSSGVPAVGGTAPTNHTGKDVSATGSRRLKDRNKRRSNQAVNSASTVSSKQSMIDSKANTAVVSGKREGVSANSDKKTRSVGSKSGRVDDKEGTRTAVKGDAARKAGRGNNTTAAMQLPTPHLNDASNFPALSSKAARVTPPVWSGKTSSILAVTIAGEESATSDMITKPVEVVETGTSTVDDVSAESAPQLVDDAPEKVASSAVSIPSPWGSSSMAEVLKKSIAQDATRKVTFAKPQPVTQTGPVARSSSKKSKQNSELAGVATPTSSNENCGAVAKSGRPATERKMKGSEDRVSRPRGERNDDGINEKRTSSETVASDISTDVCNQTKLRKPAYISAPDASASSPVPTGPPSYAQMLSACSQKKPSTSMSINHDHAVSLGSTEDKEREIMSARMGRATKA